MKKLFMAALIGTTAFAAGAREGELGAGLTLGDPTGITAKYWLDEQAAVDAAVAWSLDDQRFNLHADYLLHSFEQMKGEPLQWAYHYGIGARVKFADNNSGNDNGKSEDNNKEDASLGVRFPLGLDFYPTQLPRLEFFVEIAPVLDVIPDTDFDLEFGIGARFYFQ